MKVKMRERRKTDVKAALDNIKKVAPNIHKILTKKAKVLNGKKEKREKVP